MRPSAPVSSSVTKRPKRVTPEMAPGKTGADPVGEEGRDIAVRGVALGGDRAPLGAGDMLAHLGEARAFLGADAARAQAEAADQRAVDQQIGIAPDRRGEMRVAAQRQAEMAEIVGAVLGLRLAAQHQLVDHARVRRAGRALQDLVELRGLQHLALGEVEAERLEELAQRLRRAPDRARRARGTCTAGAWPPAPRPPRRWRGS